MGISLYAKKNPSFSMDMSCGTFGQLRLQVAKLAGKAWYEHYQQLYLPPLMKTAAFCQEFDAKTKQLCREKQVSIKIVDFCMQPDTDGFVHYGASKVLLKIIGDYENQVRYGYGKHTQFSDFKKILQDCVNQKCDLVWM